MIVVGGRRQYTYEFVPARGKVNPVTAAINLPFLRQTCDDPRSVMNNLYPFLYLLPDGNLFLFANNRSILLDPATHRLVHSFPTLPGGSRNYPSSGSSALLPLRLRPYADDDPAAAEVIVCGGAPPDSAHLAANGRFVPALSTCGRLVVSRPGADWEMEEMPTPRTMADMLLLPDANLLVVNGARRGCAGWNYADDPVLEPWVYRPGDDEGERFTMLAATTIPRMYHSSSAVLPDGRILVAGSNTNAAYNLTGVKFPTELRVEKFSPHYLDPDLADHRPAIMSGVGELGYGRVFTVRVAVEEEGFEPRVTMLLPPFTTHGYSMNQRMLVLHVRGVEATGQDEYDVEVEAPATAALAPPGYYLLFVVNRGLPSEGAWTRIR